ncbi:uncharacterized protein LOC115950748 [Quercus lobata]|uniref:uncharacterized protein LOC115950748 n=1 Tax=Quercus lobata TaxID=97700 RepID=UPI001248E569|nr:uncharacterized protein LOC115950748 [Quercus lobata]
MGITDKLCQALQNQLQDILNATHLVSSTKKLIQQFRDEKWDDLLATVISFCKECGLDVPDTNACYVARFGQSCLQQEDFRNEHYYKVDIFNARIDSQLQELNHQFSEHAMELLTLSSALDPREAYESVRVSDICLLVDNFYPIDFTANEKNDLKKELDLYKYDVVQHSGFKNLKNISEYCQWMVRTRKSEYYQLISRVVKLVLTLPVSTATTDKYYKSSRMRFRAFSLVLMMVSSCLAAEKKTLSAKMNMEAQKPLFDNEKVDVGYGGGTVNNHHYILMEDFNNNNNGGGGNSGNGNG